MNCWTELVRAPVIHTAHVIHHAAHHVARVHWIAKVVCVAGVVGGGAAGVGFAHGGELPPGPWGQRTAPVVTAPPVGFPALVFGSSPYVAFGESVAHYADHRDTAHNDHDENDNLTQGKSPPGSNDHDFDDCDTQVVPPPHHEAPEPSSLAVLGAAILSLGLLMRRRVACASK